MNTRYILLLAIVWLMMSGLTTSYAQQNVPRQEFWTVEGTVRALERVDTLLFVGGGFTAVIDPITGERLPRQNLAAFSTRTGRPTAWNPTANDTVRTLKASDGLLFVGGDFLEINGSRRTRLASFHLPSGQLRDWTPVANNTVRALAVDQDSLYLGGDFTSLNGTLAQHFGILQIPTAQAVAGGPAADGPVFTLVKSANRLYIGGNFNTFDGLLRPYVAYWDLDSKAVGAGWSLPLNGPVHALAVTNDGLTTYLGGRFTQIGADSRQGLARVSNISALVEDWMSTASANPIVHDLALRGGRLFVGGAFSDMGGQVRTNLAAIDTALGTTVPLSWNPGANQPVYALATADQNNRVFAAGAFTQTGGDILRSGISEFNDCDLRVQTQAESVCSGQVGGLDATPVGGSGFYYYRWLPAAGLSNPQQRNPEVVQSNSGVYHYTLVLTDGTFCSAVARDSVTFYELPTINPTTPAPICADTPIQIQTLTNGTGPFTYAWSPMELLDDPTLAEPTATPDRSRTYSVEVTDSRGCKGNASVFVETFTSFAEAGSDIQLCEGDSVQLQGRLGQTYTWAPSTGLSDPNTDSPMASPAQTTVYTLSVEINGCVDTDSVRVEVIPAPNVFGDATRNEVCQAESVELFALGISGLDYRWSPPDGLDNPNQPTTDAQLSQAGTSIYTLTATAGNGCTDTAEVHILVKPLPDISLSRGTDILCKGDTTTLSATTSATSFSWNPGANLSQPGSLTTDAFPQVSTNYTFTATENGCSASAAIALQVREPFNYTLTRDTTICSGTALQLAVNGADEAFWTPGASLDQPNSLTPLATPTVSTTYFVTMSQTGGCTLKDTVEVSVVNVQTPNVSANLTNVPCPGFQVQLSSRTGGSYRWEPASSVSDPTIPLPVARPRETTTYTLTYTDPNGCTSEESVTVLVDNPLPTTLTGRTQICDGDSTVLRVTGGDVYNWFPVATLDDPASANPVAKPAVSTTYTVEVEDTTTTCLVIDTIRVEVFSPPALDAGPDRQLCPFASTTLEPVYDPAELVRFRWEPDLGLSSGDDPNPLAAPNTTTTYTLTAENSIGCSVTDSVTLTYFPEENLNITASRNPLCRGESTRLTATGTGTFSWQPANLLDDPGSATPLASPRSSTVFTVTLTDTNQCTYSAGILIDVNDIPGIDLGTERSICDGSVTTLNAPGGFASYRWTPATGLSDPFSQNPDAGPAVSTTYTLEVTDTNSCTAQGAVRVRVLPVPNANAGADATLCPGESIALNASGGESYSWQPEAGLSNPSIAGPIASPGQTTNYTVTVTATNGCSQTDQVQVSVNSPAELQTSGDTTLCAGNSAVLTVSGADSYTWLPAGSLSGRNTANPIATPQATTTYTVQATDLNGCLSIDSLTVTVLPGFVVDAGSDVSVCPGGRAALSATGGESWNWQPADLLNDPQSQNPEATPDQTTTYTVEATDFNGCIARDSVTVRVIQPPFTVIQPDTDVVLCLGQQVILNVPNLPDASYQWSLNGNDIPGATGTELPVDEAGTFRVSYIAEGCSFTTQPRTVTVSPPPFADAGADQVYCRGQIGAALQGSGGGTYRWEPPSGLDNPASATPTATPPGTTTYTLTVTDANGCIARDEVTVTVRQPPQNVVVIPQGSPDVCEDETVLLRAPQSPEYIYVWLRDGIVIANADEALYEAETTGAYAVRVSVAGCEPIVSEAVEVRINPLPEIEVSDDVTVCASFQARLEARGGVEYRWAPETGLNTAQGASVLASPSETTVYTVTGLDEIGCQGSDEVQVIAFPEANLPEPEVSPPGPVSFCPDNPVTLTTEVNPFFRYEWRFNGVPLVGANDARLRPTESGRYNVLIAADNCNSSLSETVEVDIFTEPQISIEVEGATCDTCRNGVIRSIPGGEGQPYLYSLNGENFSDQSEFNNLAPGQYTLYVRSQDGCQLTFDVEISIVTGIDGPGITERAFRLYPNPASHSLYMDIDGYPAGQYTLKVLNLQGELIFEQMQELYQKDQGQTLELDLPIHQMPGGVYILRFGTGQQATIQKFILQKRH